MLDFAQLPAYEPEAVRWEARFFWPQDAVIVLQGLSEEFLKLANFKSKHRQDSYHLLEQGNYNIKLRRNELLYKPLIDVQQDLFAFGKKINLLDAKPEELLPGVHPILVHHLLELIQQQSQVITVNKDAQIYKLATTPSIKLELSRLQIADDIYFSACVEGRSFTLVQTISHHLFAKHTPSDYVHFLKTRTSHD